MMASSRKSIVFRVTGLATTQRDDMLEEALKAAIDSHLVEEERSGIQVITAIVPSCYDEDRERAALVEFRGGVPKFLSGLVVNPLGDWQIEMDDETDISFDCHFFGFTQLYAPKPDAPTAADIIAITGLDGHPYGSWRGKGNLGRMWLRDFLSRDLPHCRTMIYGYNSKLSSHGIDTIMDYGRELMEEIKKIRNETDSRQRPLFFIAHSFGGIILAHCLIKAVQTNEDDHPTIASLHRATYGILLFATPHKGLVVNDIQKMLAGQENHPRDALLQQIKHKSDLLISQLIDFKNLIRDRKVVSFYETEQTRQLELDSENRRWRRTGDFVTAVDTDSALLQLPDHVEDKIPLHSDHSMIVKFDNKNALGYRSALDRLKQFEQDAPRVVAARFAKIQIRPNASSTVPFQRDSMFVGREDTIAKISKKHEKTASQNHSRVALVGLGGVGKSQIAIEYAYRIRESAPQIWVFWIHASNTARFEQAYRDIAAKVELPERDDPQVDILRLVYNWLCDERNGRWLIILDNADDEDVFFCSDTDLQATGQDSLGSNGRTSLASFLPQASNGWILVTSRNLLAAINLVGMQDNVIPVEPMNEEDALVLLQTRFSVSKSSEREARALVQALEYIPLAVVQAAAYIRVREPRITVSTYLELFRESEANQAHLLKNEDIRDLRRDASIRHAVITTWQISFEQIRRTRPAAVDLLALMSMFDRQGIPENLLHESTDRLQFEDAAAALIGFSLVKVQTREQREKQSFEMHRLVQLSTRKWLELNQQLQKWKKKSLQNVAVAFPNGQYETWTACQMLFPHAEMVLSSPSNDEDRDELLNRATIAQNTAWYLCLMGKYAASEKVGRAGVETREKVLGHEHLDTLTSVKNLGSALEGQGKYEEAEAMHRRALNGRERMLGREHRDTLISVSNLGTVLAKQGKYDEAEAVHRRDLEGSERVFGREHPDTLTSVSNLGWVLERQGKYEEAEAMFRRDLEGSERVLGPEHPSTLVSFSNLGSVLTRLGKYEEAEAMRRRDLEGSERVLGQDHPDTLTSVSSLGTVLEIQGKYEEAKAMHRRGLEGREKELGPEHPSTLTSVSNLGSVLKRQGKYGEAEAMHRRSLEGREKMLGREHPDTLTSVGKLGSVLESLGKYEEAEFMQRRGLAGRERMLGRGHPDTLTSVSKLGSVLESQGKYEEAEMMQRRGLEGREKMLGPEHPDTLESISNLGSVSERQGKHDEAEAMYRRALEGYEKVLGREHPDTCSTVYYLAHLLHKQKHYNDASELYRRALDGYRKVLGMNHPTAIACDQHYQSMIKWMDGMRLPVRSFALVRDRTI